MHSAFKPVIIFLLCYIPLQSVAWGVTGHRVVGEIADRYLSSDARKAVKELLGNESMAMASNWMDHIKSDSNYNYLSIWHYVNIKGGLSHNEFIEHFSKDTSINAYSQILFASNQLKNKALAHDLRAMYLKILIHLVGDIHQPMHVGRLQDRGGNNIKMMWFNESTNLHQVWDFKIVEFQQLSYTEYVKSINYTSKSQRKNWQRQPLVSWFWESYQYAEEIYAFSKPDDKIGYNYNFKYISTVNQQLLKGGVRLAGLLNEIFD